MPATPVPSTFSGRIYDGQDASIEDFPYQVAIEVYGRQNCGGSIIAKNWIITAGHCAGQSASSLKIRAGTDLTQKGGSLHQVDKIILHEKYGFKSNGVPLNDVALMRVKEPFQFDETRRSIDLFRAGESMVPGKMANVSGFGLVRGHYFPRKLQWVQVPLIENDKCNEAYLEKYGGVPEGYICAAYYGKGGKNACTGDSGGPLAVDGRLAGIVSWSYNCAEPDYPTVYADVAYYRDWIDQYVKF